MVTARRSFEGTLPLAALPRLAADLARTDGEVAYALQFDRDEFGRGYVDVHAQAPLTLTCQRTMDEFVLPVEVETRLGLIESEAEEAALPEGYEPLLLGPEPLRPAAVIEDELLLALPLVPVKPGSSLPEQAGGEDEAAAARPEDNPFAVLGKLKHH